MSTPRSRLLVLLAALVLSLPVLLFAGSVNAHADGDPVCYRGPSPNVYYKIRNLDSRKALDVSHRSLSKGAPIVTWNYSGATNEQWQLVCVAPSAYKFVARHSGQVLDVTAGSVADGAKAQQWPFNGGTNQQWYIGQTGNLGGLGTYQIQNRRSGKALDASADGSSVQQSTEDVASKTQQWTFEEVGSVSGS